MLAFARASDHGIYLNAKGGGISSRLDNYQNLMNVFVHERGHIEDYEKGRLETTFLDHGNVYLKQLSSESFGKSTSDFQNGVVGSFANYLLNSIVDGAGGDPIGDAMTLVIEFNKVNKGNFLMSFNFGSNDGLKNTFLIQTGAGTKFTVKYEKLKYEGH